MLRSVFDPLGGGHTKGIYMMYVHLKSHRVRRMGLEEGEGSWGHRVTVRGGTFRVHRLKVSPKRRNPSIWTLLISTSQAYNVVEFDSLTLRV